MSLLESLKRGWWSGWAEFPELVAGGAGLLESLIPGDSPDDPLERLKDWGNEAAQGLRLEGGGGTSTGLLEKIAEGIGAAPGTLASMAPSLFVGGAPFQAAAKTGSVAASMLAPAAGFGLHGLVRHGDEGLPTAAGYGLKGAAEGALFGLAGGMAGRYMPKAARALVEEQRSLKTINLRESMQPQIDKALNTFGAQAARRAIHGGLTGGIVGTMGMIHDLSAEDVAASATTMGLLGALGGVRPKHIAQAGKYRDPFINVKRKLDELEPLAVEAERVRIEKEANAPPVSPKDVPIYVDSSGKVRTKPDGSVPASDFEAAGYRAKPPDKETPSFTAKVDEYGKDVQDVVNKNYAGRGKYEKRSDEDTSWRASKDVYRDAEGRVQAKAEDLDAMAWYLDDLRVYNTARIKEIDLQIARAAASGDEVQVASLRDIREAHIQQTASDHFQLKGTRSVLGNGMRVLGRTKKNTPEWLDAAAKVKKITGVEHERLIRMLEMSQDNPELMMKIVRAADTPALWDYFQEYWINGLLSGVTTHLVNFNSNLSRQLIDMGEKRAALEMEVRKGAPPKKFGEQWEKIPREQAKHEMRQDYQAAWQMFRLLPKILGGAMLNEDFQMSSIRSDMGVHQRSQKIDAPTRAFGGTTGKVIRYPGRMLQAMDLVFKAVAGERAAASKASRITYEEIKATKLDPANREARMSELRGFGERDVDPRILASMKKEGRLQTFTEELPPWMGPVEKLRQTKFAGTRPLVGILPFLSTPFNVIKQAILRSPLGFLNWKNLDAKYKRGEMTSKEYYQEKAATVMGSAVTVGLFAMAKAGFITGGGPENQQDRQNLLATGWRPYSIKMGDTYMQMQRLEPLGTVLGMAGDAAEFGSSEDKIGKAMSMIKDNVTDKSFLYGLESLAKAWANPQQAGSTYWRQMSGSLVPTFSAKAAQAADPYGRVQEAQGASLGIPDALAYRIPGLSQALPQRSTAMGEPTERWGVYSDKAPIRSAIQSVVMPMPFSKEREGTEVEQEFNRLRSLPGMPPSMPNRSKTMTLRGVGGQNVKLTEEEYSVYDKYHQRAKQHLDGMIKSARWQSIPDSMKAIMMRKVYDKYRYAANREINVSIRRRTTVGD